MSTGSSVTVTNGKRNKFSVREEQQNLSMLDFKNTRKSNVRYLQMLLLILILNSVCFIENMCTDRLYYLQGAADGQ